MRLRWSESVALAQRLRTPHRIISPLCPTEAQREEEALGLLSAEQRIDRESSFAEFKQEVLDHLSQVQAHESQTAERDTAAALELC